MIEVLLTLILLVPGMSEPIVEKTPQPNIEQCVLAVENITAKMIKNHAGDQFKLLAGCEISGSKADPT
jgi:hypothetical protein